MNADILASSKKPPTSARTQKPRVGAVKAKFRALLLLSTGTKMPAVKNLKVYLGSCFQRCQSMITWSHCQEHMARKGIHSGVKPLSS